MTIDLNQLSAEELTNLAREAAARAKELKNQGTTQLYALLESTQDHVQRELISLNALPIPGTVHVRIGDDGSVRATWKRGRRSVKRSPVPRPALAFAYYAVKRRGLTVRAALDEVEAKLGAPWPGKDARSRRNSLKAALSRIKPAEAVVAKLKTPQELRKWARDQGSPGFAKAAEAMISLEG